MGYQTSDIGVGQRANIKSIRWDAETGETYPVNPDDMYRYLRFCSITMFKTNAIQTPLARLGIIREGFTSELRIWQRFYQSAELTGVVADLQSAEQVEDTTLTFIPSWAVVGKGIIIPPRSRLQTFMTVTSQFDFRLDMIIIEAEDPENLAQFII